NDGATPGARISNPLPTGPQLPPGSSQGLLSFVGLGVSGPISTWNNTPYMQTWNFGMQREFKGNILLDVNYLGTKGTHLYFGGAGSINYLGPWVENSNAAQIAQLNSFVPNPFYGIVTNPASSLSSATVVQSQLLKPYPQFTYVYQVPVGRGKQFGGSMNAWADAVIGGWQTNGIWRFDNGMPVALSVSNSRALPTYGSQRPSLLHALQRNNGSDWLNQYFA